MDAMKFDRATYDDAVTRGQGPGPRAGKRKFLWRVGRGSPPHRLSRAHSRRAVTRTRRSRSSRRCSPAAASTWSRAPIADRLGQRARPVDHRREPERRRRRRRLAGHRARGARRLHADGRLRRHARHQSGRAQAALRRGQGLHADRDGRRHAERAGRAAVAAGEDAAGVRRLREGEPGQALVRLVGPGHAHASRDGAAEGRRRPRHRARPVSRHRPGDHRHPRRPDAGAVSRASPRRCRTSRPAR